MIYQYAVSDRGYLSCPVRQVLRQNTHLVDQFVVQMPAQIDGIAIDEWLLRIEMSLPGGYAYMTAALPLAGGAITYDVEQAVTADAGIAIVEIVAQHGDAVWKSSQSNYYISAAINAEQLIPQQSPTWLDQLNEALAAALAAAETLQVAETAEESRIAAETLRLSAETARIAAENIRAQNDAARAQLLEDAHEAAQSAAQALSDTLALMGQPSGVATLGADGKLSAAQLPPIAINDTYLVANTEAMLALDVQRGDVAIIMVGGVPTDSYILATDDPTDIDNWAKMGISYVAEAGHAQTATVAEDATKINGKRLASMTQSQYDTALASGTLDPGAYYVVVPDES